MSFQRLSLDPVQRACSIQRNRFLEFFMRHWKLTMAPPLLEAISEFGHPQFDPCLHGPERLVQPLGDLGMGESFVVCEFNRLLLGLR